MDIRWWIFFLVGLLRISNLSSLLLSLFITFSHTLGGYQCENMKNKQQQQYVVNMLAWIYWFGFYVLFVHWSDLFVSNSRLDVHIGNAKTRQKEIHTHTHTQPGK